MLMKGWGKIAEPTITLTKNVNGMTMPISPISIMDMTFILNILIFIRATIIIMDIPIITITIREVFISIGDIKRLIDYLKNRI